MSDADRSDGFVVGPAALAAARTSAGPVQSPCVLLTFANRTTPPASTTNVDG